MMRESSQDRRVDGGVVASGWPASAIGFSTASGTLGPSSRMGRKNRWSQRRRSSRSWPTSTGRNRA